MLAILVFGILSLVLLPLLVSVTKQAIHRCAKCLNEVKTNTYFGFNSMEDKVMTFSVGKVGIIVTRKMMMYAIMVTTAMLAIYAFLLVETSHNHEIGKLFCFINIDIAPISGITWAAFSAEVGHSAWLKSRKTAERTFVNKYMNRGVEWDGYVVRVILAEDELAPQSMFHAATVLVKMNTNDQEGVNGADLGLSLSEESLRS